MLLAGEVGDVFSWSHGFIMNKKERVCLTALVLLNAMM